MSTLPAESHTEEAALASVERLTHIILYAQDISSGKLSDDRPVEEGI
ncbi:MAG TPA: hypothetical protein VJ714_00720 [Anaerolineae bacterium]|jgi:hypothetical protein|nr:hypothetical protein [Anaerolineae bacterium]